MLEVLTAQGETYSRSQLARSFAAQEILIAGKPSKPGWKVDRAVDIDVGLFAHEVQAPRRETIPLQIVFEDEHLLVVDKPAGMVVHQGHGHDRGTLVNAVLAHLGVNAEQLPVLPGNDASRPGIVHRLDRYTSGLLVIAKTSEVQNDLASQFRQHSIQRIYMGIVVGTPTWKTYQLCTPHGRDPKDRRRFSPDVASPRQAITHVWVERLFKEAALLRFRLETGRTHQIRMHARHLGHPIVGDDLYGGRAVSRFPLLRRLTKDFHRYALHAKTLGFRHPVTGHELMFHSELPVEMESLVNQLNNVSI